MKVTDGLPETGLIDELELKYIYVLASCPPTLLISRCLHIPHYQVFHVSNILLGYTFHSSFTTHTYLSCSACSQTLNDISPDPRCFLSSHCDYFRPVFSHNKNIVYSALSRHSLPHIIKLTLLIVQPIFLVLQSTHRLFDKFH